MHMRVRFETLADRTGGDSRRGVGGRPQHTPLSTVRGSTYRIHSSIHGYIFSGGEFCLMGSWANPLRVGLKYQWSTEDLMVVVRGLLLSRNRPWHEVDVQWLMASVDLSVRKIYLLDPYIQEVSRHIRVPSGEKDRVRLDGRRYGHHPRKDGCGGSQDVLRHSIDDAWTMLLDDDRETSDVAYS
ncbi:hypothetical protein Dsin_021390 [Dipteronia sinensis]|uniref:Uncharacterized protein n=1 Tax=Dipteronia sinensis TaxID=43782 RepID=A0AAE0A037_9ROSI|nr:hypothetical protein Dsin_021390 [Dipteronia sinensis]